MEGKENLQSVNLLQGTTAPINPLGNRCLVLIEQTKECRKEESW